jgi:hypothetical protein
MIRSNKDFEINFVKNGLFNKNFKRILTVEICLRPERRFMKIKKNVYRKVCDMGGCLNPAKYCITSDARGGIDICLYCLAKLFKEIKRVLNEKDNSR